MPYDPHEPTPDQREGHFSLVWLGALINAMLVVILIAGLSSRYTEAWMGLLVGLYVLASVGFRFDDYSKALAYEGFRWAGGVFALWLCALSLLGIFDVYYAGGVSAGGGPVAEKDQYLMLPAGINRAYLLAACCALAFHAGFLFKHLKGRG